jgi:hypothetical protein
MWPEFWVYRRGDAYYCSDICMDVAVTRDLKLMKEARQKRKEAKKMNNGKITLDVKKKAVEMAINGENPLPYLKKHGAKNPSATWQYIRKTLEKKDPDTFAKLPDRLPKTAGEAMVAMKEAADIFFDQCEDMGLNTEVPTVKVDGAIRIETPETDKVKVVEKPWQDNVHLFSTAAVRNKRLGTFYYDDKHGTIDWRHPCGDEINLSADDYKLLWQALPEILRSLGVGL